MPLTLFDSVGMISYIKLLKSDLQALSNER